MRGMIALALLLASSTAAANPVMIAEFAKTCAVARSMQMLISALAADGWKAFPSLAQSHLEQELTMVAPMLEAQGLASDYTVYSLDTGGRHFELAASETKKPIAGGRKLIGCSLYDLDATAPIDGASLDALAPATVGQKSAMGDIQIEKWDAPFGAGSGMRAVYVPVGSPAKAEIGFTGMMLGTHFLDAAE